MFFPKTIHGVNASVCVMVALGLAGCGRDASAPRATPALALTAPHPTIDDATCASCHADQAEAHRHSAHAQTSNLATKDTIKGNFQPGTNTMTTIDPNVTFLMEQMEHGFFETAIVTTPVQTLRRRERIDVVIGSGRKAQTYLYWSSDYLFELPVSTWMATGEWMNSPGYPDGTANFDRGVSNRCLECHATSFASRAPHRHRFDPASFVPGISCQKCHGPGAEHVARFSSGAPPRMPGDTAIVNPAKLSRERQMDMCSLCHAGVGKPLTPPLSFSVGDDLAKHIAFAPVSPEAPIDPHGSQVQGLTASACYRQSSTMTCNTCHDAHQTQRAAVDFAANCLSCHQQESCGTFTRLAPETTSNCVDCHMPLATTDKIVLRINGRKVQPQVRNHRIGIYPSAED
jgi:hypothetical protein